MGDCKITVAGIGGVGGQIAAMLGRKYSDQMTLVARGRHAETLRERGLVLKSEFYGDSVMRPARVVERTEGLPAQDFVFICCKNYSIDQIAEQVRPCIGPDTIVMAVMNGVEPGDRMREKFPEAICIDSLIYTISSRELDYSIKQSGQYTHLFVGSKLKDERHVEAAKKVYELLKSVDFDVRYTDDIMSEVWQKFILNCGFNVVTARYLTTSGDIRRSSEWSHDLLALMQEAEAVGYAEGVNIPEGTAKAKYDYCMERQPDGATSSLRRDVDAGRPTEIDAFLGAVIRKADKYGIEVPYARRYYKELLEMVK